MPLVRNLLASNSPSAARQRRCCCYCCNLFIPGRPRKRPEAEAACTITKQLEEKKFLSGIRRRRWHFSLVIRNLVTIEGAGMVVVNWLGFRGVLQVWK